MKILFYGASKFGLISGTDTPLYSIKIVFYYLSLFYACGFWPWWSNLVLFPLSSAYNMLTNFTLCDGQIAVSHSGYYLQLQVDYDEAIFLWCVDKKDFLLWAITCITTLFLGIEIGVLVGVSVYSNLFFLKLNLIVEIID